MGELKERTMGKDKLEVLKAEREKLRERLQEIRQEELEIETSGLDLKGKYLYCSHRDLYMYIENFWLSQRPDLGPLGEIQNDLILEGISLSVLEDCYFEYDLEAQVTEPFMQGAADFWMIWKEITKGEWEKAKHDALENLKKLILP